MDRSSAEKERGDERSARALAVGGALALALALALSACSSTGEAEEDSGGRSGRWLAPSPILRQQIDDEAERMPWTHGVERLEMIRWFAAVGEPAYPTLLELATDSRDQVAATALAALGATGDRRLVPALRVIPWSEERFRGDLGLERARTLIRLGDWSELPTLIAGLGDGRLWTRTLCSQALEEATGHTFGYDPRADERERENAIRRWDEWWLARTGEGLLNAAP